ncbi:MAG: ATP-binding protein [Actinomycetota bacterium]|nr:ATP-binding protein [Actinomycetota bacterium]
MAPRRFLNRTEELASLQRRWDTGEAQLFTLWGRRRVGKTLLLLEFARDKRHLYFEATSGTRADQLADFSDRLAEATGRAALSVPDWRRALDAVADWARDGPVLLVLDEFQFLARENGDIGSVINVWWRERGEELPIFLVLAGSEVGFFEREVVNYSATTYGRRAGQRRLRPFRAHDVELFVPSWSAQDKVAAYAVFGHMPYYLAQIREEASLADNILALVLRPDGLLHEEARLLLDQELHDASAYFSVLRAIAAGQTRVSQIAQRTAIPGGTSRVSQMLELLRKLWLVDRELPVTVTNPERSRQSFYRITDPYLRFWFRFVLPAQGRLADEEGASRHLHGRVLPQLDDFVAAPAFEELCQQWLRRTLDAAAVGWWWGKVRELRGTALRDLDRELDAVAIDDDGRVVAIASCKWTAQPLPASEKERLDALAAHLLPKGPPPRLYFFAREGFDAALVREAQRSDRVHLVAAEDLFERG